MTLPAWVRAYRLCFGALAIWAVIQDFIDQGRHKPEFVPANFWSLFTNQSNLIAGTVLIIGALLPATIAYSHGWDMMRGSAVMFMTTTGVVYATLLGGLFNPLDGSHSWMNAVLHQVTPIVMIIDLFLEPPATRLTFRETLVWTMYPLLFLGYSLIRGPVVAWYPYDFVDPDAVGGYGGVTMYSIGFLAMTAVVATLSRVAGHRNRVSTSEPSEISSSPLP